MSFSFFRKSTKLATRRTPVMEPGRRVYAIGDVHGCVSELDTLLEMIDVDDARRGAAERTIILLGDLVDRGPDSAGAVERVRELVARGDTRLIKGNHEELFVLAARGDRQAARTLMDNGGLATLVSYGISEEDAHRGSYADLVALLKQRVPREVVSFLDAGEDIIRLGDYAFVHAGIRPGVPLAEQDPQQLRWIRGEFLNSAEPHGVIVVHGHIISDGVDVRNNRVGIDTGAYQTGVLTAACFEGEDRWYLATCPRAG